MSTKHFCDRCHRELQLGTDTGSVRKATVILQPMLMGGPRKDYKRHLCGPCGLQLNGWLKNQPITVDLQIDGETLATVLLDKHLRKRGKGDEE